MPRTILLLLFLAGCASPGAPRTTTMTDAGTAVDPELRAAIDASLRAAGEDPTAFVVTGVGKPEGDLVRVEVCHRDSLNRPPMPGNPSGRDRAMVYDRRARRIVSSLLTQ